MKALIYVKRASDAAAVNSNPPLRDIPGSRRIVTVDEVLDALAALEGGPPRDPPGGRPNRLKSISRIAVAA